MATDHWRCDLEVGLLCLREAVTEALPDLRSSALTHLALQAWHIWYSQVSRDRKVELKVVQVLRTAGLNASRGPMHTYGY
jgi:hypothetical protein